MLEDALLKHILEIGGVRHQKGAVKNSAVLLGFAVEQVTVPGKRVDGARILQKRQPRREQQHTAAGAAQHGLPREKRKLARTDFVPPPCNHAEEIDNQKDGLPGKEEIVIDKIQRHPEGEAALFAIDSGVIQRGQQVGKERHNIQKVVEEDVVDAEPRKRIQAAGQHRPAFLPHPAARPEVGTAAGHRHFQAEQRYHRPRHKPRRHRQRQPEKRAAQKIERVGVYKPAAQIGSPAEGAALLDKSVGVLVKVDLLVVKVPCIVEIPAARRRIYDAVRQKQQHRR